MIGWGWVDMIVVATDETVCYLVQNHMHCLVLCLLLKSE
jgi:hypothetical protein